MTQEFGFSDLPEEYQNAILEAYSLPELEIFELLKKFRSTSLHEVVKEYPAGSLHPDAFYDAVMLRERMIMVFSADKMNDYVNDCERYNQYAVIMNRQYGNIVKILADDGNVIRDGIGLIVDQKVPFDVVETAVKNSSGDFDTSVEFPQVKLDLENDRQQP